MVRWHCPPDTGFIIRTLVVWGRARYFSVTEASHNIESLRMPERGSNLRSPTFQAGSFTLCTGAPTCSMARHSFKEALCTVFVAWRDFMPAVSVARPCFTYATQDENKRKEKNIPSIANINFRDKGPVSMVTDTRMPRQKIPNQTRIHREHVMWRKDNENLQD